MYKGVWWMPWLQKGDEGRGVAAIRFGEVPNNLRSGDVRIGKPYRATLDSLAAM